MVMVAGAQLKLTNHTCTSNKKKKGKKCKTMKCYETPKATLAQMQFSAKIRFEVKKRCELTMRGSGSEKKGYIDRMKAKREKEREREK